MKTWYLSSCAWLILTYNYSQVSPALPQMTGLRSLYGRLAFHVCTYNARFTHSSACGHADCYKPTAVVQSGPRATGCVLLLSWAYGLRPQGICSALELYDSTPDHGACSPVFSSHLGQQLFYQDSFVATFEVFPLNIVLRNPGSLPCSVL